LKAATEQNVFGVRLKRLKLFVCIFVAINLGMNRQLYGDKI